jgi:antitoxin ParD1/3/4
MAQAQPVTVNLPPEMTAMMRQKVEDGEYSSITEVVQEALRDWSHKQFAKQWELQELQALLQNAIDSGSGEDGEAAFSRLWARYGSVNDRM